jgi:uncharacterized membrane protein
MHRKTPPHRLGALIDGIFAIVMTILVLDIKVPHDMSVFYNITMEHFITGQLGDIAIYMTAFITVGYIWMIHHEEAHFIRFTDRRHVWINMLILMFVALIPFSSALQNRFPRERDAAFFLAGNILIIGVLKYYDWCYATKARRLVDDALAEDDIISEKKRLVILPLTALAAIAMAFVNPVLSAFVLLLAPICSILIGIK